METLEHLKAPQSKIRHYLAARELKIGAITLAVGAFAFFVNDGFAFGEHVIWASMASAVVAGLTGVAAERYFN